MDIIYSRSRVRLPKLINFKRNNKLSRKFDKITIILFFIFMLMGISITVVTPVFNQLCRDKAKSKAIIVINKETKEAVKKYNYQDFIIVHKDENQNILMLESNMLNINGIISDISSNIQSRLNESEYDEIAINLGTFTGVNILSGRGIKVPIKISTIGNIETEVESEFEAQGINQTLHRLYLNVKCKLNVLTPFNTINEEIENQVIIVENVIVGNIPDVYYNLEGLKSQESVRLLQ